MEARRKGDTGTTRPEDLRTAAATLAAMPPPRLSRAESRARTVERLVAAATEIFQAKGFARASVGEIAEAAGYSKGAVYANFTSKEALFAAVQARRQASQGDSLVTAVHDAGTVEDLIERVGRWHSRHVRENAEHFVLDGEFWLLAARNAELRQLIAAAFREGTDNTAGLIAAETARRDLALPLDPTTIARVLVALQYGLELQCWFDRELLDETVVPRALAVLLGIRSDPPPATAD
jgi:AcrR family transcriptional regulator